jgi:hypothetical protein
MASSMPVLCHGSVITKNGSTATHEIAAEIFKCILREKECLKK